MLNFAAIDFETANSNRSSICSIGVVIVENGRIIDNIYRLVCPRPNFYSLWATEIHGLSYYDTLREPEFPEVWGEVESKIRNLCLVAHYSDFEVSCLKAVYALYGMRYPDYVFHCTCRAAKAKLPHLINHKLNTVAAHVGYSLNNHHHALADAEACAAIARVLL